MPFSHRKASPASAAGSALGAAARHLSAPRSQRVSTSRLAARPMSSGFSKGRCGSGRALPSDPQLASNTQAARARASRPAPQTW